MHIAVQSLIPMSITPPEDFSDVLASVGHKLFLARHQRRDTIAIVAQHVGVSHPVISQIENGRYKGLSLKLIHKLALYYGIPIGELLG